MKTLEKGEYIFNLNNGETGKGCAEIHLVKDYSADFVLKNEFGDERAIAAIEIWEAVFRSLTFNDLDLENDHEPSVRDLHWIQELPLTEETKMTD